MEKLLQEYDIHIYYYDTTKDREVNKYEFSKLMSKLNITNVPTLIVINQGKVVKKLEGDHLDTSTKNFLLENR
ncbi:YbbN family protein [Listeria kieliensis]